MFNYLRSARLNAAHRVYEELHGKGRPSAVCALSFIQCLLGVLLYIPDLYDSINYRRLCRKIESGKIKPLDPNDDIPF